MRRMAFFLVVNLLLIPSLVAQSPNGSISGIVHDPSGAVIAGAEILVVNDATGVQYSTTTNSEGIYLVPNLLPGSYRIQVSKIGFKTLIKPDIVLDVEAALAINFTLPVGAVSVTVTVKGGAPLVNTENATVSTVIDRRFVENLPLNGRSFNILLQLTPGVVIAGPTSLGATKGQFSISGQRTTANDFLVDGAPANFGTGVGFSNAGNGTGASQAFSILGGTSSLVSVEDLQEFRIETSSFAPEFGHSPGGQIILTTRSGTNTLHGGVYEYFRNDAMDANDWFANAAGVAKAPERHNDFGGYFGGPIFRDNTFFFFSYEGARLRLPQTEMIDVPSEYARTQAPAPLAPFLNAFPQPDNRAIMPGVYTAPFTGSYSNSATLNAGSIRIDRKLGARFSIFARYNYAPSQSVQRSNSLSYFSPENLNTQTLTLGFDTLLSTRISNSLHGNYSAQASSSANGLDSFGGAVPPAPGLVLGSLSPADNQSGFETFDTSFYATGPSAKNKTAQVDILDDLNVTHGAHQMKFGGEYLAIYLNVTPYNHLVEFISPTVQDFLTTSTVSLDTATWRASRLRTRNFSLYGEDEWKLTPRLALTYGLRWELNPAPSALGGTILAAWINVNQPSELALAPAGTALWRTSYDDFAPRVGVAYQLTKKGDFVFRAAWGLFYDTGTASVGSLAQEFPNSVFGFVPNASVPVGDPSPYLPVISTQPPYPSFAAGYAPNLQSPRSYQWNVALEKSFAGLQVISATYVGQAGRDLLRQEASNQPNSNFAGDFLLTGNDARSNYNALQLQYRRPLARDFQALLNYTWSHSLDNASNDVVAGFSNTVLSAANDYASSDFDVRHSFSGALSYTSPDSSRSGPVALLKKNWSVDTVLIARTGFPFNAVLLTVSPVPGGATHSRPDLVPGQPVWVSNTAAGGGKSLNPAAFLIPSTTRQGTEGRNDISGFGLVQMDVSIARKFPISERTNLQFRVDAFNALNHPNFTNPNAFVDLGPSFLVSQSMLNRGLGGLNPLFQEGGPRSLQLSLKLSF